MGKPSSVPLVIAHRGSSAKYPDNSIEAFAMAVIEGSDALELDVRLALDGVVVTHDLIARSSVSNTKSDNLIARTNTKTNSNSLPPVAVGASTMQELKNYGICSLEEIMSAISQLEIQFMREIPINYDIKDDLRRNRSKVATNFRDIDFISHGPKHPHHRSSKGNKGVVIDKHHQILPLLTTNKEQPDHNLKIDYVSIKYSILNQTVVEQFHDHQIKVFVYTVNTQEDLKNYVDLGVDAIITDCPGQVKEWLTELSN